MKSILKYKILAKIIEGKKVGSTSPSTVQSRELEHHTDFRAKRSQPVTNAETSEKIESTVNSRNKIATKIVEHNDAGRSEINDAQGDSKRDRQRAMRLNELKLIQQPMSSRRQHLNVPFKSADNREIGTLLREGVMLIPSAQFGKHEVSKTQIEAEAESSHFKSAPTKSALQMIRPEPKARPESRRTSYGDDVRSNLSSSAQETVVGLNVPSPGTASPRNSASTPGWNTELHKKERISAPRFKGESSEPTVNITIGHIDVRAVQQPSSKPPKSNPTPKIMGLKEYLKLRGER